MILNVTGGGANLNFKVVGGTTKPTNPKENTLWVNTDTAIERWEFSATQPSGIQGLVWFKTANFGNCSFNVLKKNNVTINPVSCQQYIGSAWVNKEFELYTTYWLNAAEYLYYYNQQSIEWQTRAWAQDSNYTAKAPSVSYGEDGVADISLSCNEQKMINGVFEIASDFGLTNYKTLQLTFSVTGNAAAAGHLIVTNRNNQYCYTGAAATYYFAVCDEQTISLDVSTLDGIYDIGLSLRWNPYVGNDSGKNYGTIHVYMKQLVAMP